MARSLSALEAAGFEVRCQIIWAKNTFAWGFAATNSSMSRFFIATLPARVKSSLL
jgi:hypothetical protein